MNQVFSKPVPGKDRPVIGQRVCVQALGWGHVIKFRGGLLGGTEAIVRLESPPRWFEDDPNSVPCKLNWLTW